jgi:hypothetical protein
MRGMTRCSKEVKRSIRKLKEVIGRCRESKDGVWIVRKIKAE